MSSFQLSGHFQDNLVCVVVLRRDDSQDDGTLLFDVFLDQVKDELDVFLGLLFVLAVN